MVVFDVRPVWHSAGREEVGHRWVLWGHLINGLLIFNTYTQKHHIHIYIYTYTHIHIYTKTHIHIYTYTHTHIHKTIYTHTHIYIYTHTGGCYGVTSITAFSYTHIYEYIHLYTYTQKHHQSFDHRRRKSASKSLSKCIFWRTCLNFELCPTCIFQLVPSCPLHLHWNVIKCPTFQQLFFAE